MTGDVVKTFATITLAAITLASARTIHSRPDHHDYSRLA